jgi:exodeoxyribonuclease VII small subunit
MSKRDASKKAGGRSFEDELKRLGEIVSELESEGVSLEVALDLFEEGTAIVKSAQKKLKESRLKVRKVLGTEGDDLVLGDLEPREEGYYREDGEG